MQLTATDPPVEVRVTSSWDELVGLMPVWTDLADRAGAGGFSRPQFCMPCWSEGARGDVWIAQAWQGDDLIALAPMWVSSVGPASLANPIGTGPLSRAEILYRPGREDAAQQIVDHAAASFTGVVVEGVAAAAVAAPAALPTRHLHSLDVRTLPSEGGSPATPAGLEVVEDAEIHDTVSQRTDWLVPGARRATPLVLVQTVADAALRAGNAVVIHDGWRGASIWLAGSSTVDLWCASGSCRPGGEQWPAALARVRHWAAGRGLAAVRVPARVDAAGNVGRPAGGGSAVQRRDVTVLASSTRRLWPATAAARRLESGWRDER